jgi:hypothetical protein
VTFVSLRLVLPLVGAIMIPTNGEDLCGWLGRDRYTRHEVTSRRAGGPSGGTLFLHKDSFQGMNRSSFLANDGRIH